MSIIFGQLDREPMVRKLSIAGTSASSGVFVSLLNPYGVDVLITRAIVNITTQSTGASTTDIGTAATAISNDGLLDGQSGAAVALLDNTVNGGTNGKASRLWPAGHYLTVAEASGDVDGLVADIYIHSVPL